MTIAKYALALAAANVAGLLGVLIAAGLMLRLDFFTGHGTFIYALRLSSGPVGILQRALLALGRAAAAFGAARIVLSSFALRLSLPFAAALTALLLVWDVWRVFLTEQGTRLPGSPNGAREVRAATRAAIPLGLSSSILFGWLFLQQ